jgi:hypothetical protein
VDRPPYERHLCAQDPEAFQAGFDFAAWWVSHLAHPGEADAIHQGIIDSTNRPWTETAQRLRLPATAIGEGFALGVYGEVQHRRWQAATNATCDPYLADTSEAASL